jgi:hypothetical protein
MNVRPPESFKSSSMGEDGWGNNTNGWGSNTNDGWGTIKDPVD